MAEADRVGVVFVSHSARIAEGLVELARQMAPSAKLVAAGGTDDGRIGTSFDLVSAGIAEADAGAGVVILCDLGSAILTAETALDFLDDETRARVRIVDAPLVEGGVAAAVAAEAGDDLEKVVAAAETARGPAGGAAAAGAALPRHPPPLRQLRPARWHRQGRTCAG
ncbi:dihydroxyacetone kinase phosphoryl donor subunit DhaM [Agromyces bauzanensis]